MIVPLTLGDFLELRDALVRTATGKLQKFQLREPYWTARTRRVN